MNLTPHFDARTASRGEPRVGAVGVDSGIAAGLVVVVDSNRPAPAVATAAATARGLLKQFGAAH